MGNTPCLSIKAFLQVVFNPYVYSQLLHLYCSRYFPVNWLLMFMYLALEWILSISLQLSVPWLKYFIKQYSIAIIYQVLYNISLLTPISPSQHHPTHLTTLVPSTVHHYHARLSRHPSKLPRTTQFIISSIQHLYTLRHHISIHYSTTCTDCFL